MVMFSQSIATARSDNTLEYTVPVINGLERYVNLLEYPPYLALALENSGIRVSMSNLVILDKHKLQILYLNLNFIRKDGQVYVYNIEPALGLSLESVSLSFKVEIDASQLKNGFITMRLKMFNIDFFLSSVRNMINYKIQLANEGNQEKILKYLDSLNMDDSSSDSIDAIIGQIQMQNDNLHALDRQKIFEFKKKSVWRFSKFWHVFFISIGGALLVIIPLVLLFTKERKRS